MHRFLQIDSLNNGTIESASKFIEALSKINNWWSWSALIIIGLMVLIYYLRESSRKNYLELIKSANAENRPDLIIKAINKYDLNLKTEGLSPDQVYSLLKIQLEQKFDSERGIRKFLLVVLLIVGAIILVSFVLLKIIDTSTQIDGVVHLDGKVTKGIAVHLDQLPPVFTDIDGKFVFIFDRKQKKDSYTIHFKYPEKNIDTPFSINSSNLPTHYYIHQANPCLIQDRIYPGNFLTIKYKETAFTYKSNFYGNTRMREYFKFPQITGMLNKCKEDSINKMLTPSDYSNKESQEDVLVEDTNNLNERRDQENTIEIHYYDQDIISFSEYMLSCGGSCSHQTIYHTLAFKDLQPIPLSSIFTKGLYDYLASLIRNNQEFVEFESDSGTDDCDMGLRDTLINSIYKVTDTGGMLIQKEKITFLGFTVGCFGAEYQDVEFSVDFSDLSPYIKKGSILEKLK